MATGPPAGCLSERPPFEGPNQETKAALGAGRGAPNGGVSSLTTGLPTARGELRYPGAGAGPGGSEAEGS